MTLEEQVLLAIKSMEDSKSKQVQLDEVGYVLTNKGNETYLLSSKEKQLVQPRFRFLVCSKEVDGIKLTIPTLDDCISMAQDFDDDATYELNHLRTYSGDELLYKISVGILLQSTNSNK